MFTGDDDLLNLIQNEAINLVDSVLEESVTVVEHKSPFNPSSFAQESDLIQHDEQQLSHQLSYDENSYDQEQHQQFQLPLINVNNYSINPDQAHSDEISDNFAIKSDCDIIVKSPTIESMSGKSFEDVDDEYNINITSTSGVNVDSSLNNNTAANITPPSSPSAQLHMFAEEPYDSSSDDENNVQAEAQNLVDTILQESVAVFETDDPLSDVKASTVSFLASEIASNENPAIVRNINDQKLRRVERKFEHLSSEVHEDDPESPDLDQIEGFVNKEDISALQNDFSKISWDESLSATTGDFGSSTPDHDLQDVLSFPGDTYRQQHNK